MAWRRLAGQLGVTLAVALPSATAVADEIRLLSGPQQTSQHRVAGELARRITPAAGLPVTVAATAGPGDLLQQLRDDTRPSSLNLAVVQADIGQLYLNVALGGNREAAAWLAPLRVVAPLYNEELHFIVRSDSAFESLQDIRNARINVGPVAGGTAMSVATLYRLLFDAPPPAENLSRLDHEEALAKMLTDRSIDVVALLADQPAPLLANMKPEARRYVRLLKFDREHAGAAAAAMVYGISALRATSYPRLLDQDVPALAVRLYLVAHGKPEGLQAQRLRRIATALCTEVPRLRTSGHRKWHEVATGLPALAPGWHYSEVSTPDLARCLRLAENEIPDVCLPDERFLGLCGVTVIAAPVPAGAAAPR
ncbi:MAG: C4-dicarboxylate ABC transporter substrate-binding protein [Rhodocyclales bacterium]|nr:C4-dicarboxylate ABC transporter substrate-binding protein [Rhodocyclales bacterium]